MRHATLYASVAVSALMLQVAPSFAQSEQTGERQNAISQLLEVISVTATKKADVENVQDVPIAVTAYNAGTLEALKVRDIGDLSFNTPNVALEDIGTTPGTANFSIRGLGVNSSIPSIDPTVGVFVDGVYLGVNAGVVFDLFDLDSVEVLRGPQGLLFGRNTTGGAVLINTGNPTDELSAKFRASIDGGAGKGGRGGANKIVQGTVSGPLVDGKLNAKIGGMYRTDGGYFINQFDGSNFGDVKSVIVRGALEYMPTDDLNILAKVEYFDGEGDGPAAQNRGVFSRDTFDFAVDNAGFYDSQSLLVSVRADYDVAFGDGTITNIFGYRDFDSETDSDIDALPAFLFHSTTELAQEQISNELRYNGAFGDFEVTGGFYFFRQEVLYTEVRDLPPLSPFTFYGGGEQEHTVWGLFGQTDWNATENLTVTLGLRYSSENKDAALSFVRPRPECSVVDGTCPTSGTNPFIPTENNGAEDEDSWSNFTPKVAAQYTFDWGQVYAGWTRGFRSGGYNFRITNPALFEEFVDNTGAVSFDEERVDAFEVGAKYQTDDRKVTLNAAAFLSLVDNMQREVNISSPTAGVSQFILNTANAQIFGFELEGQYSILDNLLLTANIGIIEAEYTDVIFDISSDGVVDSLDEQLALPRVPDLTFGIGFVHDLDLGDNGSIVTRMNFQHRAEVAYTDNNFGWIQAADMLDFNISYNTAIEGLSFSIYGRNMLDQVQVGGDTQVPFGGPLSNGVNEPFGLNPAAGTFSPLNRGRQLGAELMWRY